MVWCPSQRDQVIGESRIGPYPWDVGSHAGKFFALENKGLAWSGHRLAYHVRLRQLRALLGLEEAGMPIWYALPRPDFCVETVAGVPFASQATFGDWLVLLRPAELVTALPRRSRAAFDRGDFGGWATPTIAHISGGLSLAEFLVQVRACHLGTFVGATRPEWASDLEAALADGVVSVAELQLHVLPIFPETSPTRITKP